MIEKEPVLSWLADQVTAKEQIAQAVGVQLDKLSDQPDCGAEDWLPLMLKMAAAKAMAAGFTKVAEHVLSLEES